MGVVFLPTAIFVVYRAWMKGVRRELNIPRDHYINSLNIQGHIKSSDVC